MAYTQLHEWCDNRMTAPLPKPFRREQLNIRHSHWHHKHRLKLRGLSPQAKYIDRATAACRRTYCQLLRIEGCRVVVSATGPHGRILGFLDRSRYYFFQMAPQLYSRSWLLRESGSARNRTRNLWICSQELWPLDHRGGLSLTSQLQKDKRVTLPLC
jgi:hypothetical protein